MNGLAERPVPDKVRSTGHQQVCGNTGRMRWCPTPFSLSNQWYMKTTDYHAKLIIHGLPTMKSVTYRRLVEWLEAKVKEMKEAEGDDYAKTYTSRLMK